MTSEDTNAQLLDENPNAPICKGVQLRARRK
jgi:hypothetical protein